MKNRLLISILLLVGAFSLSAQSIYYNYGQDNFLRFEFNRPLISDDFGIGFFTFNSFLNGEFRIGKKDKIAFEVPFSRFAFDFDNFSESALGNIAIAYQIRDLVNPNYFEFMVRIPTAGTNNFLFVDYTERFASSFPDILSIEGSYHLESKNALGWYYRFKPGLKILIPTSDDNFIFNEVELLLDVNILGGYRNEKFEANAGITTLTILTEGDTNLDDRILRQFVTTITFVAGAWKPGIIIRAPLGDSLGELLDGVLGVHVGYTFGTKSKLTPIDSSSKG